MTTQLPHFRPGGQPNRSAAVQNAVMAATRKALARDFAGEAAGSIRQELVDTAIVSIVNTTGGTLNRYQAVGVGANVFDPSVNLAAETTLLQQPTFEAVFPPTNTYRGRFAVLLDTIPDGGVGLARVAGMCYAIVDDNVDVGDSVDINDASRAAEGILEPVSGGIAHVLWRGPITSDLPVYAYLALIRIGGGGGATNESIDYEVIEAGCPAFAAGQSQWVYAVVLRVDCQNTVEPGDVVQIFDPDENKFNLPVDRLVGARGVAHLRRNDGFTNIVCAVVPEPYGDCVWIVATIDCREEVYSLP